MNLKDIYLQKRRFTRWLLLGGGALGLAAFAQAAVYNFYFNNTEQGDNSTASPSVTVEGKDVQPGKVEATKADGTPVENVPQPQQAAPATAAPVEGQSMAAVAAPAANSERTLRLSVGGALLSQGSDYFANVYENLSGVVRAGGLLNVAYFPLSYLGVNAFFGGAGGRARAGVRDRVFGGAELEVIPAKLNLFGFQNVLEGSVLLGATTLARARSNWLALHAGARVGWNFGEERWMVAATVRGNGGFVMADLSLGTRF